MENIKEICHYTDLNALLGIIKKDKLILRASNVFYLNDSREIYEGIEVVKKVLNIPLYIGSFRSYYVTSFCECLDDLAMWTMYAGNGEGCALVFDKKIIKPIYNDFSPCNYCSDDVEKFFKKLTQINYNRFNMSNHTLLEEIKKSCPDIIQFENQNDIIKICLTTKHNAYKHEKESRGIFYCPPNGLKEQKYRVKNNCIVPYVEMEIPKEALKKIILGPCTNELSYVSVAHFLQINDYDYNIVEKSHLPYRG